MVDDLGFDNLRARYNICRTVTQMDKNRDRDTNPLTAAEAMTGYMEKLDFCNDYTTLYEENTKLKAEVERLKLELEKSKALHTQRICEHSLRVESNLEPEPYAVCWKCGFRPHQKTP